MDALLCQQTIQHHPVKEDGNLDRVCNVVKLSIYFEERLLICCWSICGEEEKERVNHHFRIWSEQMDD